MRTRQVSRLETALTNSRPRPSVTRPATPMTSVRGPPATSSSNRYFITSGSTAPNAATTSVMARMAPTFPRYGRTNRKARRIWPSHVQPACCCILLPRPRRHSCTAPQLRGRPNTLLPAGCKRVAAISREFCARIGRGWGRFPAGALLHPGARQPLAPRAARRRRDARQPYAERGAGARLALRGDAAAVGFHDLARDGGAPAGAGPPRGAADLVVLVEDVREVGFRDAHARVRDLELDAVVRAPRQHGDAASFGRELEGVGQQVAQDLVADPLPVDAHPPGCAGLDARRELDLLVVGQRVERPLDGLEQLLQLDVVELELECARLHAAALQELVDEPRQHARLLEDELERLVLLLRRLAEEPVLHQGRVPADHVEWRPQLVAGDADELGLQPVQLGELLGHRAERAGQVADLVSPPVGQVRRRCERPVG